MSEWDEEYGEEYYDVEKKAWVMKDRRNLKEERKTYIECNVALEGRKPVSEEIKVSPALSKEIKPEKPRFEEIEDRDEYWTVVDSWAQSPYDELLKGSGARRKHVAITSENMSRSLKIYTVLGLTMAGLLALSGRFIESALIASITIGVGLFGRWRSRWV